VSVLLGNANGTFQPQIVSTAQPNADYLAIADFNGDGKPDVAVSTYNSTTISILLGNGNGGFSAPLSATGPDQDCGLAAADFNNDGINDLAVCSQTISNGTGGDGGVAILLGTGGGNFQAAVNYPTVPAGLSGETINQFPQLGDMNNDGNLDIVVANSNPYPNGTNIGPAILLGNGDGTFTLNPGKAAVAGAFEAEVALGDFNNDGSLDVAVQNYDPGNSFDTTASTVTMLLSTGGTEVVLTSAPNPSIQGETVTFTATVVTSFPNLPVPTGTMTFELGSTNVPVTLVNGAATYATSVLPTGNTMVYAAYSGDANFNPSTSIGLLQVVKPAKLRITTTSLPDAVQNVSYSAMVAATAGTPPYTFSLTSGSSLPAGLTLSTSGVISGTPTGLSGTSNFTVQVTDSGNPEQMATANLSITVSGNLMITTTNLPSGVVGDAYSSTVMATGGIPPYTFTISSGSLPAGLKLSRSGVISGTPSGSVGISNFTVQVKDSAIPAQTATANLSITITGALMITTTSLPNGTEESPYSASVMATGGVPPYTFTVSSGTLPMGISLSSSGVFSGTPTVAGTSSFTVKATDSSSPAQTATANLSIVVSSSLMITTPTLPDAPQGFPYSASVMAIGGKPPYTFSIAGGSLPTGFALSSSGVISGTPTIPGTSIFAVRVKDSSNPAQTATVTLSIAVIPATICAYVNDNVTNGPNSAEGCKIGPGSAAVHVGPYTTNGMGSAIGVIAGGFGAARNAEGDLYVDDAGSDNITHFTVNKSTCALTKDPALYPSGDTSILGGGDFLAVTPEGSTMFVGAPGDNHVYSHTIAANGSLGAAFTEASTSALPSFVQVSPNDQALVVSYGQQVCAYPISGGHLGSPNCQSIVSAPTGVSIDPASACVYVGNNSGNTSQVAALPLSGSILGTPIYYNPFGPGLNSIDVLVNWDNKAIYVANQTSAQVTTGAIAPGCKLTYQSVISDGVSGDEPAQIAQAQNVPGFVVNGSYNSDGAASMGIYKASANGTLAPFGSGQYPLMSGQVIPSTVVVVDAFIGNPTILTATLPEGTIGVPYNATITVSGGTPPYTFSIISGSLPNGVSLSTAGVISGKPTANGTSNFTVQVKDSGSPSQIGTANLSIVVTAASAICAYVDDNVAGPNFAEGYKVGPGTATAHVGPYATNGSGIFSEFDPGGLAAVRDSQGDLYVNDPASDNITHITINKSTCALTKDTALYHSGDTSVYEGDALAITRDRSTMFVGSTGDNHIYSHTIAANGSLGASFTEASPSSPPTALEGSPDGKTLMVTYVGTRQVCAYPITAGHLGTPNCQTPSSGASGISIDPSSACVYAAGGGPSVTEVAAFTLTGGVLGAPTVYNPFGPDEDGAGILVNWDNGTIYITNDFSGQISTGTIAPGCSLTYQSMVIIYQTDPTKQSANEH
jgi:6-phosphogluconolactonase (cycloisomerase 2 family)